MRKFQNVEYTKQSELVLLFLSTAALFFGLIFILNRVIDDGFVKALIALISTVAYFWILKNRWIVKVSDFTLTSKKLEWNKSSIEFEDIKSYKIRRMKGAELIIKLKSGKTIYLTSNNHFCNSEKFETLCNSLDDKLSTYNKGQIIKKKTFLETKTGLYFTITITVIIVVGGVYKSFTDNHFNISTVFLVIASLGILWSGIAANRF